MRNRRKTNEFSYCTRRNIYNKLRKRTNKNIKFNETTSERTKLFAHTNILEKTEKN